MGAGPYSQGGEKVCSVSFSFGGGLGEAPQAPTELILGRAPELWGVGGDPYRRICVPAHGADPGSKGHVLKSQARPVPREHGILTPGVPPSESTQTVWCWPPEKPAQDLVEFLKDVRFWGTKQDSVPGVPAGKGQGSCQE